MKLATMGDVERLNSSIGHHFFDADTMRFFGSRIDYGYDLMFGRYFITTEKRDNDPRRASLRIARDTGEIESLGEFQQFASPSAAMRALEKAREAGIEVRHDPYEDVANPDSEDGYNWRAYVGELPVGPRTSKADAAAIAAELEA